MSRIQVDRNNQWAAAGFSQLSVNPIGPLGYRIRTLPTVLLHP